MGQGNIWVVHIVDEQIKKDIYRLITKAKELSGEYGDTVVTIIIGNLSEEEKKNIYRCGADHIVHCSCVLDTIVKYEDILCQIYQNYIPTLVLFLAYPDEKSCASKFAIKIKAGLTADCIDIMRDTEEKFVFTRTAKSDCVIVDIVCINTKIRMCTVKENIFEHRFMYGDSGSYEVVEFQKAFVDERIQILGREVKEKDSVKKEIDFAHAKIVFGIGRGCKEKKTYERIQQMASWLNAEIAGTRAMVEEKLIERERQVGQSGITIQPDIYIACGISGAIQHMVGVSKAKLVISINKDEKAPIVNYADYVIVGDCDEILHRLHKKLMR